MSFRIFNEPILASRGDVGMAAERTAPEGWSPLMQAFLTGADYGDARFSISTIQAWKNPWVRKCVSKIAENLARLDFVLYNAKKSSDGERQKIETHNAIDLMAKPNDYNSAYSFRYAMWAWLMLCGEAFALKIRSSKFGPVKALWLIDPRDVKEVPSKDNRMLLKWRMRVPDGTTVLVDPADMLQIALPDPFNPWRGAPPLDALKDALSLERATIDHNVGFFKRGLVNSGILSTERELDPETARDVVAQFVARASKPWIPAITHSGINWTATQASQRDMEFGELRKMNREEILASYGVPPVVVGLTGDVNYATAKEQRKGFWIETLIPLANHGASELHRQLIADPKIVAEFDIEEVEVLREELEDKIGTAKELFAMGWPINAINDRLDMGMESVQWGDVGFLPFNLQPADSVGQDTTTDPNADPNADPSADPNAKDGKKKKKDPNAQDPAVGDVVKKWFDFDRVTSIVERALAPATRAADDDLVSSVIKILEDDRGKFTGIASTYLRQGMQVGGDEMLKLLGVDVKFDLGNPLARDLMETKLLKIDGITDVTADWLRSTLGEGIDAGESYTDLSKRVKDVYNTTSSRSRTIARTETSSVVNGARQIVMQDEGVEQIEWLSSRDDATRDSHAEEDGNIVDVGETFPVTGLEYPGDPAGPPEEVINCRCITLPAKNGRSMLSTDRAAHWTRSIDGWSAIERAYQKKLSAFFFNQRAKILKVIANHK